MLQNLADIKGQELKLLFKENMAFLTQEVALDFKQVDICAMPITFKAPAFWTVRVLGYLENEKRLHVEVLDYQVGETEFSSDQLRLVDILIEVEKVTFKDIHTPSLFKTSNGIYPIKILPPKPEVVYRNTTSLQTKTEASIQTYNEPFSFPIKNITFLDGKVIFEKKIQKFGRQFKFEILNENIIAEYDAIKNYFASVLKTKKIQVDLTIITTDEIPTSIEATSAEVDKIDKTLIEEVKFEIVSVARTKEASGDKQLFTMDEYLETFVDENIKKQLLFKNTEELFENLLKKSETKHYRHLRFLSSKHNSELQKLRIVHKPFSFVFLLSSSDNFHIVWETLDTQEATYIWTYANDVKSLKQVLEHTDRLINLIIRDGKNEYINRKEKNFNRVLHDYTDTQNGFKNWKEDLEEITFLDL